MEPSAVIDAAAPSSAAPPSVGQAALALYAMIDAPARDIGGKLSDLLHMAVSACYPDELPPEGQAQARAQYLQDRALEDWIEAEALWREMDWRSLAECRSSAFRGRKGLISAAREATVNPAYPLRLHGPYVSYCGFFLLPDRNASARAMWSDLAGFEIGDDCPLVDAPLVNAPLLVNNRTDALRLAILLHEFCHAQQKYPVHDTPATIWERELDCDRQSRAELLAAADALAVTAPDVAAHLRETTEAFRQVRALGAILRLDRAYWFAAALDAEIAETPKRPNSEDANPTRPDFESCTLAVEELRLHLYANLLRAPLNYTATELHAGIARVEHAKARPGAALADDEHQALDTFIRTAQDYWWYAASGDDDKPAPHLFAALRSVLADDTGLSPLARRTGELALKAAGLFCPDSCHPRRPPAPIAENHAAAAPK